MFTINRLRAGDVYDCRLPVRDPAFRLRSVRRSGRTGVYDEELRRMAAALYAAQQACRVMVTIGREAVRTSEFSSLAET